MADTEFFDLFDGVCHLHCIASAASAQVITALYAIRTYATLSAAIANNVENVTINCAK